MHEITQPYSMTMAGQAISKDVLKKILLYVSVKQLWQARLICRGANIVATELLTLPTVYRKAVADTLPIRSVANTDPSNQAFMLESSTTTVQSTRIPDIGPIRDFGQLRISDNQLLNQCYAVSVQNDIVLYRYNPIHLIKLTRFRPQEPSINQMIIGLDGSTIAVGCASGTIYQYHYEPANTHPKKSSSKLKKPFSRLSAKIGRNKSKKAPSQAEPHIVRYEGHTSPITAMKTLNENHFLSADESGKVILWKKDNLMPLKDWQLDQPVQAVTSYIGGTVLCLTTAYDRSSLCLTFSVMLLSTHQARMLYQHEEQRVYPDDVAGFRADIHRNGFVFMKDDVQPTESKTSVIAVNPYRVARGETPHPNNATSLSFFRPNGTCGSAIRIHSDQPTVMMQK